MNLFDKAITFAVEKHSGDVRKGTETPYIVHPMEAAAIVATMTNDEKILAAAVLHDTVEDTDATIEDIEREFGSEVAKLVAAESEDKRREISSEESWQIRKQETIDYLRDKANAAERMVALGDKLSNIRAISRDYEKLGDALWERFNQHDPAKHAWYYGSFLETLKELSDTAAYREYEEIYRKVFSKYEIVGE